jgi:acyl-homoserine-lactone acylase
MVRKFYLYGDEKRVVEEKSVSLKYKDGENISERQFPIYRTHHGPITQKIDDKWVARAMMWDPSKALEQSYLRTKNKQL